MRLKAHPIWDQVLLSVQKGGQGRAQRILLVPAWEPLMTLFVDRHSDWALWTPQGYYDASVSGDELFGWQTNRGADVKPQFFRADRFRGQLERPQILRELLLRGNLPDAAAVAEGSPPRHIQDRVTELAQAQPDVQILRPRCNARLAAGERIDVLSPGPIRQAERVAGFRRELLREPRAAGRAGQAVV